MTDNNPIKENIYSIIKSNANENEQIHLDGTFEESGIGSISFIKILVEIELFYHIEIEEMYFFKVEYRSIKEFIDLLELHVSQCVTRKV